MKRKRRSGNKRRSSGQKYFALYCIIVCIHLYHTSHSIRETGALSGIDKKVEENNTKIYR